MASKFYDYWLGYDTVVLTPQMVHQPWGNNPSAVAFTNMALKIFYLARRNINRVADPKHKKKMSDELEDAATTGSGVYGVNDLKEAFKELGRDGLHRNQWRDGRTAEYKGTARTLPVAQQIWAGNVTGPKAAVEFMQAIDSKLKELGAILQRYDRETKIAVSSAKDPARNWKLIGATLGCLNTGAEKAKPLIWMAPSASAIYQRGSSFVGTAAKIYGAADQFVKYKTLGWTSWQSAQGVALKTALSYLPVLGEFYAGAFDLIPALKVWFQNVVRRHKQQIDAIPGLWHP